MRKKNVVVILCDQMQQRAVMQEGKAKMPNLKALQLDAITFSNAHTVNAICSPSRASLITGVLPHNHGMVDCTHTVPAYRAEYDYRLRTLPNVLKDAGYELGYYGKWHIERSYDLSRFGFCSYETEHDIPKKQVHYLDKLSIHNEGYKDFTLCGVYQEGIEASEEHYLFSKAENFITERKHEDKPFCLFVSAYAPHDPYMVPKDLYDRYKDEEITVPGSWDGHECKRPVFYERLHEVWKDFGPEAIRKAIRCYYAYCSLVDEEMGKLLAFLKREGLYDDTLVLFLADHGDMAGAHGLFCKGVPAYEEGYGIPLALKMPGMLHAGERCAAYVCTCDILPTILDVLDIPWDGGRLDGSSMMPYVDDEGKCGESSSLAEFHGQRYSYTQRIIWYKGLKYVFNGFDRDEMYDLSADPEELHNLIDDPLYEGKKKQLVSLMWKKMEESGDWAMQDAQYCMHRLFPVGPGQVPVGENFKMFNTGF